MPLKGNVLQAPWRLQHFVEEALFNKGLLDGSGEGRDGRMFWFGRHATEGERLVRAIETAYDEELHRLEAEMPPANSVERKLLEEWAVEALYSRSF